MNFLSDNAAGIAPGIIEALGQQSQEYAIPYGGDDISKKCRNNLSLLFETDVLFVPVITGTAANALALASVTPPHGAIFCHETSHVYVDEAGAPEFFTHGAKLIPILGMHGKINVKSLEKAYTQYANKSVHQVHPAAISITQPTEWGVCYTPNEIRQIAHFAKSKKLELHMDGARLANAVSYFGCTPQEITWKAGVDILSFGVTKNGAMAAEAVIFFNPDRIGQTLSSQKRSGHLVSKARYISTQFNAMLKENYWLKLSSHANAMAQLLAAGLGQIKAVEMFSPVEANLVFARFPSLDLAEKLIDQGAKIKIWVKKERPIIRMVCSFSTRSDEVNELIQRIKKSHQN